MARAGSLVRRCVNKLPGALRHAECWTDQHLEAHQYGKENLATHLVYAISHAFRGQG